MDKRLEEISNASKVVVMCGISGSGKTYMSRLLRKDGFHRLSPDEIVWHRYGPEISSLPFPEQREIFGEAFNSLLEEMTRLLERGEKVVVDSTMCKRSKRDAMRRFCEEKGIEPTFVFLEASFPLLKERLSHRRGTGPDDQIITEELLEQFYQNFEVPDDDEKVIVINQKQ